MSVIVRGTLWATFARVFQVAVKAVSVIFIARWLGPSEFGIFTLVLSVVALAAVFVDFGISPGTARLLAENEKSRQSILRVSVGALCTALAIGATLLFFLGEHLFKIINASHLGSMIGLFIGLLFAQVSLKYGRKFFEGLRRVDLSSKVGLALEWAPWAFGLAAIAFIRSDAEYALIGKLLGTCLVISGLGIAGCGYLNSSSSGGDEAVSPGMLLRYSFPMMLTAASFYVYSHSDILLIQAFLGEEEVGIYGVAVRLLDTLHVPAAAIGTAAAAFFVSTKQKNPTQLPDLFRDVTRGILSFYLPLVVGLILTADSLIPFLFGEEYSSAALIAVIYAPTLLMKSLSGTYSLALDYLGYANQRAVAVALSAAINLGLNVALIPHYGIVGAAIATQVTYVPLVCWYTYMLAESTNARYKEIGNRLKPVLTATVAMVIGILLMYLVGSHILMVIGVGVVVYLVTSYMNGAVSKEDIMVFKTSDKI